jgi:hypothetical protein
MSRFIYARGKLEICARLWKPCGVPDLYLLICTYCCVVQMFVQCAAIKATFRKAVLPRWAVQAFDPQV